MVTGERFSVRPASSRSSALPQSRWMSLIEAGANTFAGFWLAVLTQILVFPLFGIHATFSDHLGIGLTFTAVSLARSYVLRRLFERFRRKGNDQLAIR